MNHELKIQSLAVHGRSGWAMYRVPGIVTAGNGDILVYYEGRADNSDNRVLLARRSSDGGDTFSDQYILKESRPGRMVHNPLMIVGERDTLYFLWNENYRRCFFQESSDNGKTWGNEKEITNAVEGFHSKYPWNLFAVAPGHGLKMRDGTLVVPIWMSLGVNVHKPSCFADLYSTDGGKVWLSGGMVDSTTEVCDPTEASIAECSDGSLLATMRHGTLLSRRRAFARGNCKSWQPAYLDESLPDPVCAASLLELGNGRLFFSNCAYGDEAVLNRIRKGEKISWSRDARRNLTLRISRDDGRTWSSGMILERESGYSDLALSADGKTVYCFYESGWIGGDCIANSGLSFAAIPLDAIP